MLVIQPKAKNKIYKFCPRCSEVKPVSEFYRSATRYDGLVSICKKCWQESQLSTGGKHFAGLHKRSFPLNGKCEICSVRLNRYCYHHWDDGNLDLGIWACRSCDYLAEGLDEIGENSFKADVYHRLKKEVEEAERTHVYSGSYSPSDGIRRLFLGGKQTHKWCSHCGLMKPVNEFDKNRSAYDSLNRYCRKCRQSYVLNGKGGFHKRPKPYYCELCNSNGINLHYHHWDNLNGSKGLWLCITNKCHNLAEAVDKLDNGSLLPGRYYELKQGIIGGNNEQNDR